MAEPFLSEIRVMSFEFAPKGWALCNGQLLPINQNQALFALLGTNYGGDGRTTFGLPNLQGRVPVHLGPSNSVLGMAGGSETVTLTQGQMPAHSHLVNADGTAGSTNLPTPTVYLANSTPVNMWGPLGSVLTMNQSEIGFNGGSQAHENKQPYLVLNFCIALVGIFPSPN